MVFHGGQFITADLDGMLRIWNVSSGLFLKKLEPGHGCEIMSVNAQSNFIVSGDVEGGIVVWSLEAAMKGNPAELIRLPGLFGTGGTYLYGANKTFPLRLGNNFIAKCDGNDPRLVLTDFC